MNIAQTYLSLYESDNFKQNYTQYLLEDSHHCIDRILTLFNVQNYEVEKALKNYRRITREEAQTIFEYIRENQETFESNFNSYYVGPTSIDSISYGEQEEQLEGIYNRRTGKPYTMPYLKKVFDQEGYYVNDNNYAYYDLSMAGTHIDILNDTEALDKLLQEIEQPQPQTV